MLRPGQAVAVCVLALLTVGVVMVNSAGMTINARTPLTFESILLSRSTIYAGVAMLALAACALMPIRRLAAVGLGRPVDEVELEPNSPALEEPLLSPAWLRALIREYISLWPLWLGVLGLLVMLAMVYAPGISSPKNGSHRWVNLHVPGFESVQPSELAKWGLILLVAWYASRSGARMKSFWVGLVPGLAAIGLVAGFVVIEDLGTGALMVAASALILIAAGARLWHMALLFPLPAAGAFLAIVSNPYRMHRIESFMNPYLDPQGKGFHMIQSMVSVANGKVFGTGLGGSLQKFGYLPEDTTDFIFAIICDELGIMGALVVLFLLGCLVWSVWQIVRRERTPMLKLIGLGVMTTVGVQALINLAVVTGLGPTKGIALPLVSSGGTGWILTAAALGLVIAIDRSQAAGARLAARRERGASIEPDGYAVPALGVMAMSAAAATATMAEATPEPVRDAITASAVEDTAPEDEVADEPVGEVAEEAVAEEVAPGGDAAEMFAGVVVAEPVTPVIERRIAGSADESHVSQQTEVKPGGVFPGLPGETGMLFDPHAPAAPKPEIVVTDTGKHYLTRSGEESAA
ncbi:MAG TPA: putative peptidoglycan glycosyltransferase FtsW [Phycisphaerales bacterium]|nr:putative peptidoglycan glycosyltransferase FtsW [Phycisphaerales bacterium]